MLSNYLWIKGSQGPLDLIQNAAAVKNSGLSQVKSGLLSNPSSYDASKAAFY